MQVEPCRQHFSWFLIQDFFLVLRAVALAPAEFVACFIHREWLCEPFLVVSLTRLH